MDIIKPESLHFRVLCVLSRLIKSAALSFLWLSASALAQIPDPGGDPEPQVLVGELSGEFSVNNLGAFNYTVPLAVSPGTAGVEPGLAISYSSRRDNGLLGVGFSLDGLSAITRGGASLDQDGFIDGVDFDDNDRFLLDGQRLELVSTNGLDYGDAGSEYRTEIDSFSRVIAYGQAGSGPAWFRVWTRSGLIYEYGNTTDSAFKPGSHDEVLSWHVNKVSDTLGNYMTFSYATNSAGPVISRIDYTGNTNASLAAYNSVEFEYEGRPDNTLHYFMGVKMEQTNRLAKIVMKHDGDHIHDYRLGYTNSAAGRSLLASLQQCFGEGEEVDRLPETRFEYSGISVATNMSYQGGWDVFKEGSDLLKSFIAADDRCLEGDFNGDGLADVCSLGPGQSDDLWLALSAGDGTFEMSTGTAFLPANLSAEAGTAGCAVQTGDFNGDGLTDIFCVGPDSDQRWAGIFDPVSNAFTYTSGADVLPSALNVYRVKERARAVLSADFNGDGLTDICSLGHAQDERWLGLSNGDGTFDFTNRTGWLLLPQALDSNHSSSKSILRTGDFNGDGRTDVCSVGPPNGGNGELRWVGLATTNGTFSFTSGTNMLSDGLWCMSSCAEYNYPGYPLYGMYYDKGCAVQAADFNGDGLTDICSVGPDLTYGETCWLGLSNGDGTFDFTTGTNVLPASLEGYAISTEEGCIVLAADFNGDGLSDLYSVGNLESRRWLGLSKGDGTFDFTEGYDLLPSAFSAAPCAWEACEVEVGDFNGDGLADVCSLGSEASKRWVGISNGDGTFDYTSGISLRQAEVDVHYYSTADFDGNGLPDIFGVPSNGSWYYDYSTLSWVGMNANEAARLEKVVQGYRSGTQHGVVTEIEYSPLSDTNLYIKGSGAQWPVRDTVPAMYVVSSMKKDNAQGGTYITDYTYRAARRHLRGRGFLGFQQFESYDRQTRISTIETLAHDFPFTGRVLQRETCYLPDSGSPELIGLVENDWHYDLVSGGTLFAFCPRSVESAWEPGGFYGPGGTTNAPYLSTTNWSWYDNQSTASLPPTVQPTNLYAEISYGNLVKSMVDYGGGLKKTTLNGYDDWVDATHWLLGRLDESEVTHEAPGQTSIVRSSAFDYDALTGLLSQETIEPDDAQFELITDYYYDSFGNITNKTLSPAGLPSRTIHSVDYDSRGRFVEKSRNALGHETLVDNNQATGKPTASTDPNGLITTWSHDPTGRVIKEMRPDGTATTSTYSWDDTLQVFVPSGPGSASNIVQTSIYKLLIETGGAPPVTTWFDKNGREIRMQTESADGRLVNKDTGYNAIAQAHAVSEPYFAAGGSPVHTFTGYDALSRPVLLTAPDVTQTAFGYHGLTTTTTNNFGTTDGPAASRNQVTTTTKNAKGETVLVVDNMGYEIEHVLDPVGNLIKTIDELNNEITMEYDLRGNKIRQDDPDMGEWFYTYNALDQLTAQTNANSKVTAMEYDLLGRMVTRTSPEGTAQWTFDNTGEGGKLGALWREEMDDGTNLVQRKTYAYDSLKRPMLELQNVDNKWYYTTFTYDSYSRVKETHRFWRPQSVIASGDDLSPTWNSFTSVNTYNSRGVITNVVDGSGHVWWSCDESDFDARGNLLEYMQGNDVVTTRGFDSDTGRITGIGLSGLSYGLHSQTFSYDRLGNVTLRSLSRTLQGTLSETCGYDSLNRLTSTQVGGSQASATAYNAIGNITARGGVTDFSYGQWGGGPHAVTTAGGVSHLYDSCGNLTVRSRGGSNTAAIAWTSFNKPSRIDFDVSATTSTNWSEFTYDANHHRTTQTIRSDDSLTKKLYLAGFEQTEVSTNLVIPAWSHVETRVFVATPMGTIGIHVQDADESVERRYLHRNHLGSVVAVTGTNGTVLAEYSFDAWGTHRDPDDWTPQTSNLHPQTSPSSDRGFTGHEMLDHLGLVHMNGWIYDNALGRFLSPDPFIQSPENLQSFNRYSYVFNNPLTYTDPSGFIAQKIAKAITSSATQLGETLQSVALSALDNIGGTLTEASKQVEDYYSDSDGNSQVDQTTVAATAITVHDDENIGSTADLSDQKGYGTGTGNQAATTQSKIGENEKFVDGSGISPEELIKAFENDLKKYYRDLSKITGIPEEGLRETLSKWSLGAVVAGATADGAGFTKIGKDLYWQLGGGKMWRLNKLGEALDLGAKGAGVAAIALDGVLGVANLANGDIERAADSFWSVSAGATAMAAGGPVGWAIGLGAGYVTIHNAYRDHQIEKYNTQSIEPLIFSIQYTNRKINELNGAK